MLTSSLRYQRIMSFHEALWLYQLFLLIFMMIQLYLTMFQLHSYPPTSIYRRQAL